MDSTNETNTNVPRSEAFHLQMNQEMDESVLEAMLKKAGIPVRTVRTVTPLLEGVSFTHLLAEGQWNEGTGAAQCSDACPEESPRHVLYQNLTPGQRDEVHRDMAKGLEYYRANLHDFSDGEFQEMDDVRMAPCPQG